MHVLQIQDFSKMDVLIVEKGAAVCNSDSEWRTEYLFQINELGLSRVCLCDVRMASSALKLL